MFSGLCAAMAGIIKASERTPATRHQKRGK